jgi:hypothetical protein
MDTALMGIHREDTEDIVGTEGIAGEFLSTEICVAKGRSSTTGQDLNLIALLLLYLQRLSKGLNSLDN